MVRDQSLHVRGPIRDSYDGAVPAIRALVLCPGPELSLDRADGVERWVELGQGDRTDRKTGVDGGGIGIDDREHAGLERP